YPVDQIDAAAHRAFVQAYRAKYQDSPRLGSLLGYMVGYMMKDVLDKAGGTDTARLLAALAGARFTTVIRPGAMRGVRRQSTLGAWVGETARNGKIGTMRNWTYADGAAYLFPEAEVKAARKE